MIKVNQKGDFSKLSNYLKKQKELNIRSILERYGAMGVTALQQATPVDTGLTASSWSYKIVQSGNKTSLQFHNTNVQSSVNIAIILQYGHATKGGGWVQGRDYINPAVRPVFDSIANEAWKEVTRV